MYKTPGVFIKEPPSFPPSVVPVETAIPVFIGFTQKIPAENANEPLKPVKIFNLDEFESMFGKIDHTSDFSYAVDVTRDATGEIVSVEINMDIANADNVFNYNLYHALSLYFSNGGGPCYIVSAGLHNNSTAKPFTPHDDPSNPGTPLGWEEAVAAIDSEDEPTLFVIPELVHTVTDTSSSDYEDTLGAALMQCLNRKDRFTIIDVPQRVTGGTSRANAEGDITAFRENYSSNFDLDAKKFGAAYYPYMEVAVDAAAMSVDGSGAIQTVVVVNETDSGGTTTVNGSFTTVASMQGDNEYDSVYQEIVQEMRNLPFRIPASAAIAGVYAKVDDQRGVFKAPANVSVASVIKATTKIDDALQGGMNVHPSGKAINPVRTITDRGLVVWGARTLDANNLDFRYINVRRFFNFVEESVKKAMYRFVFEPNDANTWAPVRAAIENFLTVQWEAGALQGAKADDAFRVYIGLGQTMVPQDILEGILKVRIEMAIVRPAEFIVLEFKQVLPSS